MNFSNCLTNPNVMTFIFVALLVVIFLITVVIVMAICGIKTRTDHIFKTLEDHNENIHNLTQASKRVERMCDAINQRTRSYSNSIKSKTNKIVIDNTKSQNNKKGGRKYDSSSKKKRPDTSFTVRDNK